MTNYILFQTACGCSRIMGTMPDWKPEPILFLPTSYPTEVYDWVQGDLRDDQVNQPNTPQRKFRLEKQDVIRDDVTVWCYTEIK